MCKTIYWILSTKLLPLQLILFLYSFFLGRSIPKLKLTIFFYRFGKCKLTYDPVEGRILNVDDNDESVNEADVAVGGFVDMGENSKILSDNKVIYVKPIKKSFLPPKPITKKMIPGKVYYIDHRGVFYFFDMGLGKLMLWKLMLLYSFFFQILKS